MVRPSVLLIQRPWEQGPVAGGGDGIVHIALKKTLNRYDYQGPQSRTTRPRLIQVPATYYEKWILNQVQLRINEIYLFYSINIFFSIVCFKSF